MSVFVPANNRAINTVSVDVEDWFQVFYGEDIIHREDWANYPSEFSAMVDGMLAFFEEMQVKCTFFVVGWLARQYPHLVLKLHAAGHEVASHGYAHKEAYQQKPDEYMADIVLAKDVIEQAIGHSVLGYRAPGYSVRRDMPWAVNAIQQAGYKYDSSLLFEAPGINRLSNGLIEVAPNSITVGNTVLPTNGGFFFRAIPYWVYRLYCGGLRSCGVGLNFYTHSWEVHPPQNRIDMVGMKKFIQYFNTSSVQGKLRRLLAEMDFVPIREAVLAKANVGT